jgi:hypothetical protein
MGRLLPVATAQVWPQLVGGASCLPRRPASGGADQHHRQRTCFRDGRLSSARRTVGSYPAGLHLRPNHTDLVWQSPARISMSRNDPQGNRQGHRHADAHDRQGSALSEMDLRMRALESLLVKRVRRSQGPGYPHRNMHRTRRMRTAAALARSERSGTHARKQHGVQLLVVVGGFSLGHANGKQNIYSRESNNRITN